MKRKTVLITGATSGIGGEFAEIFAEMGYDLVIASRSVNKMEQLQEELRKKYSVSVQYLITDLSLKSGASNLYQAIKQRELDIDVLINNSGIGFYGDVAEINEDKILDMLQLNILSLTELTMKFAKDMKEKGSGYILNVASTAAYQPLPYMASYGGSKSYVLNFSEAIAKELEEYGVVVSCLSPGPTKTDFFKVAHVDNGVKIFNFRMNARTVAQIGVDALFSKKISVIAGVFNFLLVTIERFLPRCIVACITKKMLKRRIEKSK